MSGDVHAGFCEGRGVRFPPATHRLITCRSRAEAHEALRVATRVLETLGVHLNPQKTRIVHVRHGFEFLGYKIKRGKGLRLPASKIRSGAQRGASYAYPTQKSIGRFKEAVRNRTRLRT